MENKNVFIALLLMLAVWTGYTMFFVKPSSTVIPVEEQAVSDKQEVVPIVEGENDKSLNINSVPVVVKQTDEKARDFIVETDDYMAVFTNVGARLKSFELKKYFETIKKNSPLVSLIGSNGEVSTFASTGQGGIPCLLIMCIWQQFRPKVWYLSMEMSEFFVLQLFLDNGVVVEKIYTFKGTGYDLNLKIQINNQSDSTLQGSLDFLLMQPWFEGRDDSRYPS